MLTSKKDTPKFRPEITDIEVAMELLLAQPALSLDIENLPDESILIAANSVQRALDYYDK
jgi:hypothetical protein